MAQTSGEVAQGSGRPGPTLLGIVLTGGEIVSSLSVVPTTPARPSFQVNCWRCRTTYEALTASFCGCLASDRSLVCPSCFKCSCATPAVFRRKFWTSAPLELAARRSYDGNPAVAEPMNLAPNEVRHPLVLLLDVEPEIRGLVRHATATLGYGLVVARNENEGLNLCRTYRPEVILGVALTSKPDRRDICFQIKSDSDLAALKVILINPASKGYGNGTDGLGHLAADDYLSSPLGFGQLQAVLEKHLGPAGAR